MVGERERGEMHRARRLLVVVAFLCMGKHYNIPKTTLKEERARILLPVDLTLLLARSPFGTPRNDIWYSETIDNI